MINEKELELYGQSLDYPRFTRHGLFQDCIAEIKNYGSSRYKDLGLFRPPTVREAMLQYDLWEEQNENVTVLTCSALAYEQGTGKIKYVELWPPYVYRHAREPHDFSAFAEDSMQIIPNLLIERMMYTCPLMEAILGVKLKEYTDWAAVGGSSIISIMIEDRVAYSYIEPIVLQGRGRFKTLTTEITNGRMIVL